MFAALSPVASKRAGGLTPIQIFAQYGVWSSIWLPDRGITFGGTLKAAGTAPPAVSLVSAPSALTGLWLDIPTAGVLGVGTVRYSLDDGATYSAPQTLAATMLLGGFELTFAAGTYNTNNTYQATVSAWTSLEGYVASQATPGKQPVYSSVAWNGYPSLTFDGVDDYLLCISAELVAPMNGTDSNIAMLVAHDSGVMGRVLAGIGDLSTSAWVQYYLGGGLDYYSRPTVSLTVAAGAGRRHFLMSNVATQYSIHQNGALAATAAKASVTATFDRFVIGAKFNATFFAAGNIPAVLLGSTVSDPAGLTAQLNAMGIAHA